MKTLLPLSFVLLGILMMIFQDTPEFIAIMNMLFGGNPSLAPPPWWVENRLYFIVGFILLLLYHYRSIWNHYRALISIYSDTESSKKSPPVSAQQASYIFLQDKAIIMTQWLIEQSQNGMLKLDYRKGPDPWSVSLSGKESSSTEANQNTINRLFKDKRQLHIAAQSSDPQPEFKQTADLLFKRVKSDAQPLLQTNPKPLFAWLVFIALIVEIPFLNALYTNKPGMLAAHLGVLTFTAAGTFGFRRLLPFLFTDFKILALAGLLLILLIAGFPNYMLITAGLTGPFFEITLYLEIAVILLVLIHNPPLLPKDKTLLTAIVAFKKHLEDEKTMIKAQELQWIIGLQVHADIFNRNKTSHQVDIPTWLSGDEEEPRWLLARLFNTLTPGVRKAIYGETKSSSGSMRSGSNTRAGV